MEILKKDILKEIKEKSRNDLNRGIDISVSILKHEFPFITGWDYKNDPETYRSSIYLVLMADMNLASEFYNSPIRNVYKRSSAKVSYPFSPLEISTELNEEEKYELFKVMQNSLKEIYDEIPSELRHEFESYASEKKEPKELYIEGFIFEKPKENINESKEKTNYIDFIKEIIEPFKNEDCVCDINVNFDEEDDDMYSVYVVTSTECMSEKFDNHATFILRKINKIKYYIKEEIKSYLPIDNLYVGSYGKPNCGWSPLNESKERPNKEVIINIINELILPNYKDDICSVEYIDKDERLDFWGEPSFNQSRVTITFIGEKPLKIKERDKYDNIMNEIWDTIHDYVGISVDLYARYTDKCEKENINESVMGPEYLDIIKDIVEIYEHEDFVCDIEVSYDDEDGMYSIMVTFDSEELLKIRDRGAYARQIRNRIGDDIVKYIPDFLNFYVWSYVRHCKESINENWIKVPSYDYNSLEKIINMEMREKYSWWKDIKINTLNYIEKHGGVQIEAELTVDEEWGGNQWREFHPISEFPGNKGWEDDGYELVRFGDIIDSTYAEVIIDDLREILKYTLNIDAYIMSFRNIYLIFE